jgi:hypothetical protein
MTALGLFFTGVVAFVVAALNGRPLGRAASGLAGFGLGLIGVAYVLCVVRLVGWGLGA